MTLPRKPHQPVAEFGEVRYISGQERHISIQGIALLRGAYWLWGIHILMVSHNGRDWQDAVLNLREEGEISICYAMEYQQTIWILARSKSGLRCYVLDDSHLTWKVFTELNTDAPCAVGAFTSRGLIVAAFDGKNTTVLTVSSNGDVARSRGGLSGTPRHLQLTDSGQGFCSTWQVVSGRRHKTSNVYNTDDYGNHWELVATFDGMILSGARISDHCVLVGGTDGLIAIVDQKNAEIIYQSAGDDVVGLDCNSLYEIAILESETEVPFQLVLLKSVETSWRYRQLQLPQRVACVKLTEDGRVLICTRNAIYEFAVSELILTDSQVQ